MLPGLWNGAMSNWLTVFVQVPLVTLILLKRLMIYSNQHINCKRKSKKQSWII
jgi:hypothetical protein